MSRKRRKSPARRKRPKAKSLALPEALALAMQAHKGGDLEYAEDVYRKILDAAPEHPDALHYMGVLSHILGRSEEGIALIRRAIAHVPDFPDMLNNLGNVCKDLGRLEEAEAAYRQVLSLDADHLDALNNLGIVLKDKGELDEAEATYARALELEPDSALTYHNLANVYRDQGRLEEAIAGYDKALDAMPFRPQTYKALARIYYMSGLGAESAKVFRRWLSIEPNSVAAKYLLAACTGEDVPERASDTYVKELFDGFAASFDTVLKRLEYRAPELVAAVVAGAFDPPSKSLDVLDAGCGTGLCGPLIAPYASRLTGVDLSPDMVAKARGRGDYDELVLAELTAFLEQREDAYDLIASADTLCYFGALEPVLTAAAGALKPGGRLVFTVEHSLAEDRQADFRLHNHGRYSHSEDYVRAALGSAGLKVVSIDEDILRNEFKEPVSGLVVLAGNPAR